MRTAFGETFDVPDGYLNTASIGIPSTPVADAVAAAVQHWRTGAAEPRDFDDPVTPPGPPSASWSGSGPTGWPSAPTVSGLLGLVAAGLPPGTRVLVAGGEFTSVSFPFAAQIGRGVTVVETELERLPEQATGFDVAAVSVVQSADGRIVDLEALRAAQATGTLVVLDATQALGWYRADLGWADVVAGTGYKWLFSPRGAAWMAVRGRAWTRCRTRPVGTPGRTGGPASTGCRCGWPPAPAAWTPHRPGSPTSARRWPCPGWPAWTGPRCRHTASGWPTSSGSGWA